MASKIWYSVRVDTPAPRSKPRDVIVPASNHHGARSKAVLACGYGTMVRWVRGPYFLHEVRDDGNLK